MTLNEEEIACGLIDFGGGCLVECVDAEKGKIWGDFDDSKSEKGSQDIADSLPDDPFDMEFDTLPADPFGMDFNEALVEVISDWIEDLGLKDYGFETEDNRLKDDDSGADDSFFVVWTGSMEYEQEDWEIDVEESWCLGSEKYDLNNGDKCLKGFGFEIDEVAKDNSNNEAEYDSGEDTSFLAELNVVWTGSMEYEQDDWESEEVNAGAMILEDSWGCEKYENEHVKDVNNGDGDGAAAIDILIFVVGYLNLGVKDLLTIEMVCKSLRDAVRKDPYLWTKIHIDSPLNEKICNDNLLKLTDRAQGKLCSLGLLKCLMITDDGLQKVLERNLELTKLSVAGSIKLSVEGVLNNLKVFNSIAKPGIKHLRIADINHLRIGEPIGITNEHLREFKLLLGADEDAKPNNHKSRFYSAEEIYLSLDDERAIDIETCPRCQILRQVYDCPTENCRVAPNSTATCKACIYCIARCIQCGCCLDDKAYEELFSFEFRCFDCLREFLEAVKFSPGQSYFHPMASYHFIVYS